MRALSRAMPLSHGIVTHLDLLSYPIPITTVSVPDAHGASAPRRGRPGDVSPARLSLRARRTGVK